MRISIQEDDPGFDLVRSQHARIELDGEEVQGVITADEEEGFILAFLYDENGDLLLEGEEALIGSVYGTVKITLPTVQ